MAETRRHRIFCPDPIVQYAGDPVIDIEEYLLPGVLDCTGNAPRSSSKNISSIKGGHMAEKKLRVVHYLNQFFGQIGGKIRRTPALWSRKVL